MTGTELRIPLRDGLTLGADVYGSRDARAPVLLIRTPYGKQGYRDESLVARALGRGYVVVVADVRGRYTSQGEFDAYRHEGLDGYDAIEWLATQPWSTGRIATAGLSYPGAVQWLAAVESPPHLACAFPAMCFSSGRQFFYFGGAFDMSWLPWTFENIAPDDRRRLGIAGGPQPRGAPVVEASRTRCAEARAAPGSAGTAGRHAVLLRLAGPSRRRPVLGVRGYGIPIRARSRADLQLQRLARRRLRADRRDAQLSRPDRSGRYAGSASNAACARPVDSRGAVYRESGQPRLRRGGGDRLRRARARLVRLARTRDRSRHRAVLGGASLRDGREPLARRAHLAGAVDATRLPPARRRPPDDGTPRRR